MSVLRYERTDKFYNMVLKTLNEKYDGNIIYYNKAEEDTKEYIKNLKKLKSTTTLANSFVLSDNEIKKHKITNVNLVEKSVSLIYDENPEIVLAYTLEYLSYRRMFPYSINNLIDKNISKDRKNSSEEAENVIKWVKHKILEINFNVAELSLNKNSGLFRFGSIMRDPVYGSLRQEITAQIPSDREINISGTIKGKPINLAKDYNTLFTYFIMFGLTELNARCNCPDYIRKYSKRRGIGNYFCPHILYSMAQLPYYMMYVLFNR